MKIDITKVTSADLKAGKYKAELPEYYQLANFEENNPGNDHQLVLDHVIGVYGGLEEVLKGEDLTADEQIKLTGYLAKEVETYSSLNLLKIATLLHDIAKDDTLMEVDGTATCPGHELIGAARVKNFAERFNLNAVEEELVRSMVRDHGLTWSIADLAINNKNWEKYLKIFKETVGEIALELVLMMQADALGADLDKLNKVAYDQRIEWLVWMKKELLK